jgi:hypothetical protein
MVFANSALTSLGIKTMHVLYFLVTAENPTLTFIDKCSIIICPSGTIFIVHHHVKITKATLCYFLILDCLKFIPF